MGILADTFRARLDDLKARGAETDRLVAEARQACDEALAEMDRLAADLRHL